MKVILQGPVGAGQGARLFFPKLETPQTKSWRAPWRKQQPHGQPGPTWAPAQLLWPSWGAVWTCRLPLRRHEAAWDLLMLREWVAQLGVVSLSWPEPGCKGGTSSPQGPGDAPQAQADPWDSIGQQHVSLRLRHIASVMKGKSSGWTPPGVPRGHVTGCSKSAGPNSQQPTLQAHAQIQAHTAPWRARTLRGGLPRSMAASPGCFELSHRRAKSAQPGSRVLPLGS